MILYSEMALGLLSNSSCKPVAFSWKAMTFQPMKSVDTKVDRLIGADTVPLIRKEISSILLPKFSTSSAGSSVSLIFCKAWDKLTNDRRVELLIILDNGTEDLVTRGPVTEEILDIIPKIKYDGCKHRISAPSKIVAVKVAYRKKTFFSVPNPHSCKVLDPLGDLTIFGCSPFI